MLITPAESARILRQHAEEKFQINEAMTSQSLSPEETVKLLHELQVHQIELEIQNEELRHAQVNLEFERAKYFKLCDQAPVGYLTVSDNGLILEANLAAAAMLGVVRNFLLKKPVSQFIFSEDRNVYDHHSKRLIDNDSLHNWVMRMKRVDNSPLLTEVQVTMSHNGEFWITLNDISERKLTENKLRESEELFMQFMMHSPVHTYVQEVTPTECRTLLCTDSFTEMLGLSRLDMIGKTMQELFPPELAAKITADSWAVVSGGNVLETEEEFNGRHYKTIKFPIVQQSRKLVAGYTFDISDRMLAEAALHGMTNKLEAQACEHRQLNESLKQVEMTWRQSIRKFEALHKASPVGIAAMDSEHNLTHWNPALEKMFGWTVKEVLGGPIPFIPAGNREEHVDILAELMRGKTINSFELQMEHKDGTPIYVSMNTAVYHDDDMNIIGVVGLFLDITERKSQEETLRQAHELLETRVLERTEELRRSLEQTKKVSLELLLAEERERERIAGELHDQVGQSLLLAKIKLSSLSKFKSDLLHEEAKDISTLVQTSIREIRALTFRMRPPFLKTSGIDASLEWLCSSIHRDYSLQVDFVTDKSPKLLSVEVRYPIYQAVRELLLNIVKHAGVKNAQLLVKTDNKMLLIHVKDKGVGFSLPDVGLTELNNFSYGFYNVQQRIENIGGRFEIESAPGKGTTATLMVPLGG